MMSEERMTFKIMSEGKEVNCEVLFTFESDETKKNYIVYTDNTTDKDGNIRVYASIYDPNKTEMTLEPIETDAEWSMVEQIMNKLQESAKEANISSDSGEESEQA